MHAHINNNHSPTPNFFSFSSRHHQFGLLERRFAVFTNLNLAFYFYSIVNSSALAGDGNTVVIAFDVVILCPLLLLVHRILCSTYGRYAIILFAPASLYLAYLGSLIVGSDAEIDTTFLLSYLKYLVLPLALFHLVVLLAPFVPTMR